MIKTEIASKLFLRPSSRSPELESLTELVEEDITTMEFLEDPQAADDSSGSESDSDTSVVEEPPEIMDPEYYMKMVVFKVNVICYPTSKGKKAYDFDNRSKIVCIGCRSCTDFFNPSLDELNDVPEDQRIIKRDDISKEDFRALLKLLYPMSFTLTRTLSDDEWISVLKVSTRWIMLDIRRMAIEHLTHASLPLADRIILARECSIISWLRSAYLELVSQLSSHDEHTTETIGLETTFKLHRARESLFPLGQFDERAMNSEIEEEFREVLGTLSRRSEIELAVLAHKYGVSEWRKSAFIALARRHKLISYTEAQLLGFETAIRLCGVRELRRSIGTARAVELELNWDFDALESYTAVQRVAMARGHEVCDWFVEALSELVQQKETLSVPEARDLGLPTAIALCLCRARHFSSKVSADEEGYRQALELEFGDELEQVEAAGRELLSQSELLRLEEEQKLEEKRQLEHELRLEERSEEREMQGEKEGRRGEQSEGESVVEN
ncbi:hypothetical protein C0995_004065 [Termitomyces sp. Mi166|nr:hypothetical protein C0995_004065 [Termitomyces sp. Mi166\